MKHTKRNIYSILATVAFSVIITTGCSGTPEKTDTEASTHHEASTENTSSSENESLLENTTSATDDNSSSVETATIAGSQNETTTALNNNTDNNSGDNGSSNNSGGNSGGNNSGSNGSGGNSGNNSSNSSGNNTSISSGSGNVVADKNSDKIVVSYGGSTSTEAKKLAQAVIDNIITKGMSDFEKAKAIHDYMVMNIDYDYDNYLADTIPNDSYNAIGAFKNKYAVCSGYAKAFMLLCDLAGLECTYVTGTAGGPHAWNQVKVDGKWYNVDVTWDDPVSSDKAFDDHKYNRYSYFLISDELIYKDHKANGTVHTCSSSLHGKAYEIGGPWEKDTYTYVKNDAELSAVLKKIVNSNASSVSIKWDTNWIKISDISKTVKAFMLEYAMNDFSVNKYIYVSIPNTSLCNATFYFELTNNKYTTIDKLCTADDIKKLILTLKDGNPDQATVPMANELVSDDIFYEVAVWAYKNHDVSVQFYETEIKVNSTTKAIHVYVAKNNYHGSNYADEAYCVETMADITGVLEKLYASPDSFRIIYRYGDELGRLSAEEAKSYVKNKLAPAWAKNFCYESYEISCDDFICVMTLKFHNSRHVSESSWGYAKEPTCIEGGIMTLKCSKCGRITQSHEVEATGIHDTYWVYDNDTTRHLRCNHCSYTGPTLYKFGDIWGYFDDTAATELFAAINKQRETASHYNRDPEGNLISIETPPQLTLDNLLTAQARTAALEAASLLISGGAWRFDYNLIITYNQSTVAYACSTLTTDSTQARNHLNNKYLTKAGVCCFYFDKDGTGNKMTPIWCLYYGE